MSWLRIDDGFANHNKVLGISDAALRLWVIVSCWSHKLENLRHEGRITAAVLPGVSQHRWPAKRLEQLVEELVGANGGGLYEQGLWVVTDTGWQIHNWHVYGIVGAEPDSLSAKRADAGRKGAASRWQSDGKQDGKAMASHVAKDAIANAPIPIPIPRSEIPPPPSVVAPQGADIAKTDLDSFAPDPATISAKPKSREKKPRPVKWSRFPGDFEPDESHRKLAAQLGLNLTQQLLEIRDHEFAKPKSDAAATLRTWLRNAPKFGAAPGAAAPRWQPPVSPNVDHETRKALAASKRYEEMIAGMK